MFLFGCGHQFDIEDPDLPNIGRTPDSTVYLVGNGTYWINGVYGTYMGSGNGFANSISYTGSKLLIGGQTKGKNVMWRIDEAISVDTVSSGFGLLVASQDNKLFRVWYDNIDQRFMVSRNGTETAMERGHPCAITILNDDVYSAGYSYDTTRTHALVWKNSNIIFKATEVSLANSIFIHNGDVYTGGLLGRYSKDSTIACYWKNGQVVKLSEQLENTQVTSLFVTNDHVYAAGIVNYQATVWIDGIATTLSNSSYSLANSIFVFESDVYVAGLDDKGSAIWKNGERHEIEKQWVNQKIQFVTVVKN